MEKKTWLEAVFLVPAEETEDFLAVLSEFGLQALELEEPADRSPSPQASTREAAKKTDETIKEQAFKAYLPTSFFDRPDSFWRPASEHDELAVHAKQALTAELGQSFPFPLQSLNFYQPEDWSAKWKEGFQPFLVGKKFAVLPPWEQPFPAKWNLVIQPGQAFGTGYHATTQLMLELLESLPAANSTDRALDFGAGSGILTLALAHLGWKDLVAIECDPVCEEEFHQNTRFSNIPKDAKLSFRLSAELPPESFDLVLANVTSDILLAKSAWPLVSQRFLVCSGVYQQAEKKQIEDFFAADFNLLLQREMEGWHSFLFEKKNFTG